MGVAPAGLHPIPARGQSPAQFPGDLDHSESDRPDHRLPRRPGLLVGDHGLLLLPPE